jgi:hypothetical protein
MYVAANKKVQNLVFISLVRSQTFLCQLNLQILQLVDVIIADSALLKKCFNFVRLETIILHDK